VSRKIRHVQALEALGSDVLVLCADVSDQDQADRVVTLAAERFGALHGVIHAAGLVSAIPLQEAGEADCQAVFAAKVNGLYALAQALRGTALDFAVVTSSLSSVLGGLGLVAYAAANAFLDLFAQQSSQTDGVRWMSINWDRWRLAGKQGEQVGMGAQAAELFIAPEEGIEAWKRLLSHPEIPQVVVSTGDLHARIDQWIRRDTGNQAVARESEVTYYSRPAGTASFVAPRNGAEQAVARFWQELLGIDQIGIHDNFFEMGGNSLIATQLVARLRRAFGVDLALRGLLEAPTVGGMAEVVEARLAAARQELPAPGEEDSEEFEL
jgi:aryl carrier-like protein